MTTRTDLEEAVRAFVDVIKSEKRSAFWRAGDKGRRWSERPERIAQDLLHVFLRAKFEDDTIVLQEIAAGAGRLDLLMIQEGGFRAIIELKMLGPRAIR